MMKKIMDQSGNPVRGLLRDANGAIIVDDSVALNRYKASVRLETRVAETERKVDEMHSMLQLILKKLDH
jgi:hypothetical protein